MIPERARVILADDHTLLLEAFCKLLEPHCDIVATVGDGRALLEMARELQPDIVIMDISMPKVSGLDAGRRLKELVPDAKLVFLTVNEDPGVATEAIRCGASAYLLKSCAATELFEAISAVREGGTYVTPTIASALAAVEQCPAQRGWGDLSPRQREVLQLLTEGLTMKEVATQLHISPRTVAFHKYQMMEQLRIESSAELIRFAVDHGMRGG